MPAVGGIGGVFETRMHLTKRKISVIDAAAGIHPLHRREPRRQ